MLCRQQICWVRDAADGQKDDVVRDQIASAGPNQEGRLLLCDLHLAPFTMYKTLPLTLPRTSRLLRGNQFRSFVKNTDIQ